MGKRQVLIGEWSLRIVKTGSHAFILKIRDGGKRFLECLVALLFFDLQHESQYLSLGFSYACYISSSN